MSDIYKENYELKEQVANMKKDFTEIVSHIYCIGGPLNDNLYQYNNKQKKIFFHISSIAEGHIK